MMASDDWAVLGNTFVDQPARTIINNNHAIYVQNGADNVEVAYNQLVGLRMGHVIQVHQDVEPMLYENVWIHDNLIQSAAASDTRGITVSNVDSASTIAIERNILKNLGQDFSAIAVYRGHVTITDNLTYDILGPAISLNGQIGGTRVVSATGNRLDPTSGYSAVAAENGASMSDIALSKNAYCGGEPDSEDADPQSCDASL